jgi:hypothetical protein
MSVIRIQGFKGTAPRVGVRLLGESNAQVALNAKLFSKEIRGWRASSTVLTPNNGSATQAIYRYVDAGNSYWLDWSTVVNVARVPVTGDAKNRIFFTGATLGTSSSTVTMTIASPCVVSWATHGLSPGTLFKFSTTGALPTGLTAGVVYMVLAASIAAGTFQIGIPGVGTPINTSGSQSGTHIATIVGMPKKAGNDIINASGTPAFWNMGVQNPMFAPASAVKASGASSGTARATSYVITHVTAWGEESGPSPPLVATLFDSDTITVTRAAQSPPSGYNIVAWNVYRTVTGASGVATYYYIGQQATYATTTFSDAVPDATLVLNGSFASPNTPTFAEPPSDLTGLTTMPNGMLAGFSPTFKQVCFSEPYFPYAWPVNYRRGLIYDPVACGASGNMLVVATTGKPTVFVGNTPAQMSGDTLDALQACLSARSLAETPFGVVWASPDGLYMVSPDGSRQIITRSLYDKQLWQSLVPGGMIATVYDGRYYAFTPGLNRVLVLDPNEPDDALTFLDVAPSALFSDFNADGLYMVQTGVIIQWDVSSASYLTATWRGKVFTDEKPNNKGWGRILFNLNNPTVQAGQVSDLVAYAANRALLAALAATNAVGANGGPCFGSHPFGEHAFAADDFFQVPADIGASITFNLYGDSQFRGTATVTNQRPFRLPGGYTAQEWELESVAQCNVEELAIANDMSELQKVN